MLKISISSPAIVLASLLFARACSAQNIAPSRDWTTWGYDQERTGWNKGETSLSKSNVSRMKLLWNTQLNTPPQGIILSTLTAPLVAEGLRTPQGLRNLLFLLGADDTIFALDTDTGKVFWQRTFANP